MKAELTINLRPIRHAYFIGEDDLERFIEVACFCCTQWGGINNLIIPVKIAKETDDITVQIYPYFMQMMNKRHSDIFVNAISNQSGNSSIHDALNDLLASKFPGKLLDRWDTFIQLDNALHPLNITSSERNTSKPELVLPDFSQSFSPSLSNLDDALKVAAFGKIWPGQEEDYEEVYILNRRIASYSQLLLHHQMSIDPHESVINLTLKDLHNLSTENIVPSLHFDVVIAQSTPGSLPVLELEGTILWTYLACG